MAFDGVFLRHTAKELEKACGCRVEKIHQPAKSELVFLLRKSGAHFKLLISARPGAARVQFTAQTFENPPAPPMFCMLMRKHLCGAKLCEITQQGIDRILFLHFEGNDEMGDKTKLTLVLEFLGAKSNIILVGANGRIIDALRRTEQLSEGRLCLPGAVFETIAKDARLCPFSNTTEQLKQAVAQNGSIGSAIAGLSPLICREFENNIDALKATLDNPTPTLTLSPDGEAAEFSFCPINQYGNGYTQRSFNSYSELLDEFYGSKDREEMLRSSRNEITKTVNTLISRTARKLALRRQEREDCAGREQLRIFGELLKANISTINITTNTVTVKNYYSEQLEDAAIPVNPALSVAANAAKYFKEYKKACVAAQLLDTLIEKAEQDLVYFGSVLQAANTANSRAELDAIREELISAGVLRARRANGKPAGPGTPFEYYFAEYRVLAGKNNRQNDILTFKAAGKNDLWFHAKDMPGAHIILFCNNKPPRAQAIEFAAKIAAKHSSGAASGAVSVDYTYAKYVKKPPGAKPGMVTYDKYSTVFIRL